MLGDLKNPAVKLLDFGLAKRGVARGSSSPQTVAGIWFGTPQFMAPEQVREQPVSDRTDLYAFGGIAFQMLTGRLPFLADNLVAFMMAHVEKQPPLPQSLEPTLPAPLASLLMRLLAKNPADRPSAAAALDLLKGPLTLEEAQRRTTIPPMRAVDSGVYDRTVIDQRVPAHLPAPAPIERPLTATVMSPTTVQAEAAPAVRATPGTRPTPAPVLATPEPSDATTIERPLAREPLATVLQPAPRAPLPTMLHEAPPIASLQFPIHLDSPASAMTQPETWESVEARLPPKREPQRTVAFVESRMAPLGRVSEAPMHTDPLVRSLRAARTQRWVTGAIAFAGVIVFVAVAISCHLI